MRSVRCPRQFAPRSSPSCDSTDCQDQVRAVTSLRRRNELCCAGTPTQAVEAGYMANAYVRLKHPDFDVLRGMLNDVGETITVHAG